MEFPILLKNKALSLLGHVLYRVEKNGPRARASLRLPGTGERERRGNTEPFEGLFSRPDTVMATLYLFVLSNCDTCEDTVVCTLPPPRQPVAENRWMEDINIRPAQRIAELL